ncbi:DDE-type integrase/transposase/recombinase [Brevundimonas diminuta]|uniref:DDE-type integrase/transposase/recombinase n=1 Tax=Brevundimonas diminuta TaxID=293 RepID=UPI003D32B108
MRFHKAALNEISNPARHETGRWLNSRIEDSHLFFRRLERAMQHFLQTQNLQQFSPVHAAFHNHFNLARPLISR